jgi:N-acetylmuramoyl-L-alanine amidase
LNKRELVEHFPKIALRTNLVECSAYRAEPEKAIRTITNTLNPRVQTKQGARSSSRRSTTRFLGRHQKHMIRYGLIAGNVLLLVAVVSFVLKTPDTSQAIKQSALSSDVVAASPLDQLSSSDIAVHVARMASLPEATAVVNQADTISSQLAISSADSRVVAKPQIVSTEAKSYRDIQVYVTKSGDTLARIANRFKVTSDSIRWSNNLSGNELPVGREIYIPPVNGIVYLVKAGDSADKLAREFSANADAIKSFNDAEVLGLSVGRRIVIPDGIKREEFAVGSYGSSLGGSYAAQYGGNGYDYGWCTWHAADRRGDIGRPIPNNMGNAISWLSAAQSAGLATGGTPRSGAVVYHLDVGGWGHVAFVERVNDDGSAYVSDMNFPIWGSVTYRTIEPSEFRNYRFIY